MAHAADRAPHHLSFGERRRVALATVLAMRPDVLVLDEPSSNLDPQARRELAEIVLGLDVTTLMVTHDLPYALQLCAPLGDPRRRPDRRRRPDPGDPRRPVDDGRPPPGAARSASTHSSGLRPGRSVGGMSDYVPPLEDMRFALEHVVDIAGAGRAAGLRARRPRDRGRHARRGRRFFAEQFAPLNRVGDVQHSRRNPTTARSPRPTGFPEAYQRYVDAGWGGRAVRARATAAAASRGWSASPCRSSSDSGQHGLLAVPAAHPGRHRHAAAPRQRGAARGRTSRRW